LPGLSQIVALPEQGGQGYHIEMNNPFINMDGWEVNHELIFVRRN